MRRTNHLPISQYENRLEIIQEEYLQKHFQQIAIVLSKNYHYGFQIIKSLWSLQPTKREKALRIIYKNVRQVIERRKVFAVGSILRKYFESKYSKSKSCVYIATFLQRKIVGLSVLLLKSINQEIHAKPKISKEKHLFLLISLSNLKKLFTLTKTEAFHAIKHQSMLRKQQRKKAALIKLTINLSNRIKKQIIDAFFAILQYFPQQIEADQSLDSEDEGILIESYKIMATNLNKINLSPSNTSLRQIKKESSTFQLIHILSRNRYNLLEWSFTNIYCNQNYNFRYETVELLKRQIAILEQQYQQI